MRPADITFALDRLLDLHRVHAGRDDLDDETAGDIAVRAYEGAGLDGAVIETLFMGLNVLGQWRTSEGKEGPFAYLEDDQVVKGVGFGILIGAVAQEHAMERKVKQLREALALIAEPEPGEDMFGRASAEKRIARVALEEVDA